MKTANTMIASLASLAAVFRPRRMTAKGSMLRRAARPRWSKGGSRNFKLKWHPANRNLTRRERFFMA